MTKQTRRAVLLKALLIIYLAIVASITLVPAVEMDNQIHNNLIPMTNIDDYVYDIVHNGVIHWDYLRSPEVGPSGFFYEATRYSFRNLFGNIALFVPLGLLYPLTSKRDHFMSAMLKIILTTGLIEVVQYLFIAGRSADIDDILLNTVGGLIGYGLYRWIR
ncbi:MAG: VanZ family protein [Eubacteriaceae bacterium]|jgi:glycopeptide antibiotics resistance protein|nr:VanZ family protein [Eubacteriaceae bacterium]